MSEEGNAVGALIGTTIGEKYRVVRLLGEGGMGAVYEGEHTLIKRRVAIKVLKGELASNVDVITRFHREAMAATQIGNEHIVEVTDMGRLPDGGPFMVLEYLEGQDLAHAIETEGPLSISRVARIVRQMCEGLAAAHDKGIVHRDLKPENVFLVARGGDKDFVKILDFGISKILDAEDADRKSGTRTGTVLGTGFYMAPEQAMGKKELDHRADVWALGVILFRALSGQYPFDADTYAGLLVKVVTDAPRELREVRPGLPEEVYAIVARCLSKTPDQRYPDCRALARALAPLEQAVSVDAMAATAIGGPAVTPVLARTDAAPPTRAVEAEVSPSVPPRRARAIVALSVAGALGVAGLVFALAGGGAPPSSSVAPVPQGAATPLASHDAWTPPAVDASTPVLGRATVRVRLASVPAGASMTLDGAPLPNPFDDELPRGADMHVLETSAAGYRTDRRDLSLLFSQDVTVTLVAGRGTSDSRAPHATGTRVPPASETTTPGQTIAPPPSAPPPSSAVQAPPPTEVPEGVVVPPESRVLKHLGAHH